MVKVSRFRLFGYPDSSFVDTDNARGAPFVPTRLIFAEGPEPVVGVEDDNGRFVGIVVRPGLIERLKDVLPSSGERLVALWRSYQEDRGAGPFFFSELLELVAVIEQHPEVAGLRKLTGFRDGRQVFHDVLVGKAMSIAMRERLSPRLIQTDPCRKTPDLEVFTPTSVPVEVKTLTRASVIDVVDEGIGINLRSAKYLAEAAVRACDEAFQQAPGGIALLGVWCDYAGSVAAVSDLWSTFRLKRASLQHDRQHVLLHMRTGAGEHWYQVSRESYPETLRSLMLDLRTPRRVSIRLTGGAVNVVRGAEAMSVGRCFQVGRTGHQYGEEEVQLLRIQPEPTDERLAAEIAAQARAFLAAVQRNPFTPGRQMVASTDERFIAIFGVAQGLADLLPRLSTFAGTETERPTADLAALAIALETMRAAIQRADGDQHMTGFQALMAVPNWSVGSSRVDLQACKLEYSIVSPK